MDYDSTMHPVTWFRDRYREGNLEIRPAFQRKPVWTARQKCYLVESILMNLPVPEIYVQQTVTDEGDTKYAIVDGQQRIRAVLQFVGSESDPLEADFNKFSLDKLDTSSPWYDLAFANLPVVERTAFYGYRFAVRYLNTNDIGEISDLFTRLNRFLSPLKPQELRNATYSGPFAVLSQKLADDEYWSENRIISPALIRRMNDIEFVSELLIGVMHGPQGGSPSVIDDYYKQYEDYEDEFPGQAQVRRLFSRTLNAVMKLYPKIKETRWSNKTDYYTLFVAIAGLIKTASLPQDSVTKVRRSLDKLVAEIDLRFGNEKAKVSSAAAEYVRSVQKGANDKVRRGRRHVVVTRAIEDSV